MAYVRKTKDEYEIQCDYGYGQGFEYVCAEETRKEANERRHEYLKNDTQMKRIRIVKKRIKIVCACMYCGMPCGLNHVCKECEASAQKIEKDGITV